MANEYLRRNFTSTGNLKEGTFSFWMKGRPFDTNQTRPVYLYDGSNLFQVFFERTSGTNPGQIIVYGGGLDIRYKGIYRDPSAWSHYLIKVDNTTNGAEARFEVFVNGVRLEIVGSQGGSTAVYPTRDANVFNNVYYINATGAGAFQVCDYFYVDGQALTPDVFGFYKQGKGYISVGSTQATDFRPGQWVPKTPRVIKTEINRRGGFGVNGFYLPMNDSNNFGADFHGDPNSIITLNEKLPQPRVGVASTASVGLGYTDVLRSDPYAANLVLAIPGVIGGQGSGYGDYSANIKGSGSNKTVTANGNAGVALTASYYGSALSFDGSGDYLSIPDSSDFTLGSENFTIECWFNPNAYGSFPSIVHQYDSGTNRSFFFSLNGSSSPLLKFYLYYNNGTSVTELTGVSVPLNQWTHVVAERQNNILSLYQNGVVTGIATNITYIVTDSSEPITIGDVAAGNYPLNGYIQDLRIYKGVAKYTGGFDVPRPYTPVGIATWRAVPDTTANNFATFNRLIGAGVNAGDTVPALVSGNLYLDNANQTWAPATIGVSTGKYYAEFMCLNGVLGSNIGVCGDSIASRNSQDFFNKVGVSYIRLSSSSVTKSFTSTSLTSGSIGYTSGDIVGVTLDVTNKEIKFFKNNVGIFTDTTLSGFTTTNTHYYFTLFRTNDGSSGTNWSDVVANFGQNPTFSGNTTAGTYTDTNGKGLFKYQPPSDFLALCEDNLPTPAISDPGKYFKTVLWTGDGASTKSIVGVGFTPDLVWMKGRTVASDHSLIDSVRGPGATSLNSNQTYADNDFGLKVLSFDKDGFSVATGSLNFSYANTSGSTYAAWCWRAGAGTTSTNTNGSITSVVSVNQDAGFSIVSYRSNGTSGATVGHQLNKTPSFIIVKMRSSQSVGSSDWAVYHKSLGATKNVWLNATNGANTSSAYWNNTEPTSSVFSLGNDLDTNHTNGYDYISYCWAEIEGFSKFGSYIGNNSTDGPFVYCGFKPAWLMIKNTSAASQWRILDSSRDSVNPASRTLRGNDVNIEDSGIYNIDFLSNGFKLRATGTDITDSGNVYIFAAWAESPFSYSNSK
jgi:hypothetical protein